MAKTWLSFAIRRPGPARKQGYPDALKRSLEQIEGEVKHSMEGRYAGAMSVLFGPSNVSWHLTVTKEGLVYQHYPLEAICWHAGLPGDARADTSLIGNLTLVGIEHEGFAGEPLTEEQYQATLRLSREIRRLCPRVRANPPQPRRNLWEHRWLSATSCPSGRIPWERLIRDLQEVQGMTPEEKAAFEALKAQVADLAEKLKEHLKHLPAPALIVKREGQARQEFLAGGVRIHIPNTNTLKTLYALGYGPTVVLPDESPIWQLPTLSFRDD